MNLWTLSCDELFNQFNQKSFNVNIVTLKKYLNKIKRKHIHFQKGP